MRRQMWMPEITAWCRGQRALHFAVIGQFEGRVTADAFQNAVTRLACRHPFLAARVVAEPDHTCWFETEDANPIETCIVLRTDEASWLAAAAETVGPLFDFDRGPLARVTLVAGPDRGEIILALHHCAADGLSGAYALHDLLTLLGDPAASLPPVTVPRCPADLLPRWSRALAGLMPLWLMMPGLRRKGFLAPLPDFNTKHGTFHILTWTLPPERTATLVTRSRAKGVTVHSALSTAILRAWGAVLGGNSHTVSSPVSVRHHFTEPVGKALSFMIWPYVKVTLPYVPETPFWEQARRFQARLKPQTSTLRLTLPLAIGQRVIDRYPLEQVIPAFSQREDPSAHTLSISNLGRLTLNTDYGPLRLVGFFGPLLDANAEEVVLGVATTNGTLACTLTFRDPVLDPANAAQIRDAALAQLDMALA
jgi:NRPS condensation-like uncharacterized protein